MHHVQLDQLAMLSQREACTRAREARLVASLRGARRGSRAAVDTVVAPVRRRRFVPAPR